MSPSKLLIRALRGERTERVPFWFMRQAGRYLPEYQRKRTDAGSFLDMVYAPDFAVEVSMQPIRRYAMDAAILFADILVIPDALGQQVAFEEGRGPVLEPLDPSTGTNGLDNSGIHAKLAPIYETVKGLCASLPGDVTLIGFAGAPWTVATYMVEGGGSANHAKTKAWAYNDPDGFGKLIALLVEATSEYLLAQVAAGAEVIQLFDTWAGSLPEGAMRRWCIEPVREIITRLRREYPDLPVIGFPRGVGPLYRDFARETKVSAVGIDTALSPAWAAKELQPLATVQGNLDPCLLVTGGEAMRREAVSILKSLAGGPHIFNLGHGILPETPPEHVAELSELVRAYRHND